MWTRISGMRAKSQQRGSKKSGQTTQHFEIVGGDGKDPANLQHVPLFYDTHK
jgi:hypothetical protein